MSKNLNAPNPNKSLQSYLTQHKGIAHRVKTIFDYHYDQIIREIPQEIPAEDSAIFMDSLIEYMEESINFPDTTDLESFIQSF